MARRALRITYGNYVAGYGQPKRHVHGPTSGSDGPERFSFNFELQIAGCDDAADWGAEIAAARAAFEKPFQDLRVDVVDEDTGTRLADFLDARESAGAGLNIVPSISDPEAQEGKSGRSWVFRVSIEGDRPATHDPNFLRQTETNYSLSYSASRRRTLRVSGVYTRTFDDGGATTGARAQYEAQVSDYVTTIQTGLGGDWQVVPSDESSETPYGDDTIRWTRTYEELLIGQSAGVLDDPDVVSQTLVIDADDPGTEDDPSALPLQRVTATYSAALDAESSSATVQALWKSKLEAWVILNLKLAASSSQVAIMNSRASYDPVEFKVSGRVEALVARGTLLRRLVTTRTEIDYGWRFRLQIPVEKPGPFDATPGFAFRYGRTLIRTVTTDTECLGSKTPPVLGLGGGQGQLGRPRGGGGFRLGFGEVIAGGFDFVSPGGGGGRDGEDGGSVSSAGIVAGAYRTNYSDQYVQRTRGRPGSQFATTAVVVTERYRILAPPVGGPAGASDSGGDVGQTQPTRTR